MCINPGVPGTGSVIPPVILEATSSMTTAVRRQIYVVVKCKFDYCVLNKVNVNAFRF